MQENRWILAAFVSIALVACNREKKLRNKECGDFAEWSNKLGQPITDAVSEAEKRAATTYEQQAAVSRKLAEGARKTAQTPIPFSDPFVKDLATRRLKAYEAVAVALDHQGDAWAKGDKEAQKKAVMEEMDAYAPAKAVTDDWLHKCHLQ